jgi:hypothetical protein
MSVIISRVVENIWRLVETCKNIRSVCIVIALVKIAGAIGAKYL